MAVALASIDPADGALGVWRDYPVTVEITDATDIDPSLVEVVVNGISCTVANGGLEAWNTKAISGGAQVDDLTDVYFGTLLRWWGGMPGADITVSVVYDGTTLDTVTFTDSTLEGDGAADCETMALSVRGGRSLAPADVQATTITLYAPGYRSIQASVVDLAHWPAADARCWVAHRYWDYHQGSAVLGHLEHAYPQGSGSVRGWRLDYPAGSAVLQGWQRDYLVASGCVGVTYHYYSQGSGVVGLETLAYAVGGAVVEGVNRDNTLRVRVIDEATYAALIAAGVVIS